MSKQLDNYMELLAGTACGAVICNQDDTIIWANEAAGEFLGVPGAELTGENLHEHLTGFGTVVGPTTYRHILTNRVGQRIWLQRAVSEVSTAPDDACRFLHLFTDLSEFDNRRRARSAILSGLDVSRINPATGILTRQAIMQELAAEISRSRRYKNPLSMIMVRYSDCGRLQDAVVERASTKTAVARGINETLRWVDSVGSLASGVLLIVLPETDDGSVKQVARKVASACAELVSAAEVSRFESHVTCLYWDKDLDPDAVIVELSSSKDAVAAA